MYSILVCDDEKDIVSALKIYLSAEGYRVLEAYTGKEALEILSREKVYLVLLDIMMPEMDGIQALTRIREEYNLPVIFLSAKGEDTDKVLGLNLGADDYITKPFNPVELLARIRSQIRRYTQLGGEASGAADLITVGDITLDDRKKEVCLLGEPIALTPTEYDILHLFLLHPSEVLPPKKIYEAVWKEAPFGAENTVAVHIRHIREKLEINPAEPRYLKVVWGQGYKLEGGK